MAARRAGSPGKWSRTSCSFAAACSVRSVYGARGAEYPADGTERAIEARLEAGGVKGKLRGAVGRTELDEFNTWTLHGVGCIRLRDWSIAERQRPDGAWVPDPEAMPNEKARPLVLRRQLEQVACMAKGEPHRLARVEEALEVQAIVEAILRA